MITVVGSINLTHRRDGRLPLPGETVPGNGFRTAAGGGAPIRRCRARAGARVHGRRRGPDSWRRRPGDAQEVDLRLVAERDTATGTP